MQDKIEREISIKASKERVYAALTDPAQIVKWFSDAVEGDLTEGNQPILSFGEHGKTQIYVVATRPYEYFAFRWVPGANYFIGDVLSTDTTLVEFNITEAGGVSIVTMTESGFAKLPVELAEASFQQNTGGWSYMLLRLEKLFSEQ